MRAGDLAPTDVGLAAVSPPQYVAWPLRVFWYGLGQKDRLERLYGRRPCEAQGKGVYGGIRDASFQ